jgi:putative hydrolase of the HAD superfamily
MIKAVFFDLYHTLVRYQPPREELQASALREFGLEVSPERLRRPLLVADEFVYQEIARSSLSQRPREEQMAVWAQYERIMLQEAGIEADERLILGLLGKMERAEMKLVLFDDVIPALTSLKGQGLTLGLISNADRDLSPLLNDLGLLPLLGVVVTSQDVGGTKPQPEIFLEAARRAGIAASEAVYVGDQYQIDVVGARGVGMKGILLDRDNYFAEITDCPRIQSLLQLAEHLASSPD